MATRGWVADLKTEERKNWVKVSCALNIAKKGITSKIQDEMETWYQSLITSPPLQSLPSCTCAGQTPKCTTCVTWKSELTRHHMSPQPRICWKNSVRKQWGSPTGAWEIAKVFMPTLGSRTTDVVDAETTDIGGLLNLLEWCPFIDPPLSPLILSSARENCRNLWAHAPKQELQDADVTTIFGHLNNLLSDPVFIADKVAQKASNDLQELFRHDLVIVRESDLEIKAFDLKRQFLVDALTKYKDEFTDNGEVVQLVAKTAEDLCEMKEQGDLNKEDIGKLRQQLKTTEENLSNDISSILNAVDDFNRELNKRDDLGKALDVIHVDVKEVTNTTRNLVVELKETQSRVANLENMFFGLQRDVTQVKERVDTLKENDDNVDMLSTAAPGRLTSFTGRKSALEWLEMNVVSESPENGQGTSFCIKTICGLGGCGKTSLAVEFAWMCKSHFPGGVFWINGESDENIIISVVDMLALVDIAVSTTEHIDDTLNRFLRWLSKKKCPWLLVVDNADELQDSTCPTGINKICRGFWQRNVNASKYGHILLTTRQNAEVTSTFLRLSDDECLELPCFSKEEGALFLMEKTGLKGEPHDQEAALLSKELGELPLALEQAAAFISASRLSFKDYLRKYQAVKVQLLKRQPVAALGMEARHRLSVYTTWEMNFAHVEENSPAAASLMRIVAFLESNDIPFDVINPGSPELDQGELRECARSKTDIAFILNALQSYSLFSVNHEKKVFSVHKLVQEVVKDGLTVSEKREAMEAATRLLNYCIETPETLSQKADNLALRRQYVKLSLQILKLDIIEIHTKLSNFQRGVSVPSEESRL